MFGGRTRERAKNPEFTGYLARWVSGLEEAWATENENKNWV